MSHAELTERERKVLEAVIESYVVTAEPAGSRTIARRFPLGVSAATIRNTMGDLEHRGYLYHPHTSAGRVPTDRAYRVYVDSLMGPPQLAEPEAERLRRELRSDHTPIEGILQKAAQVLGVLTQELGLAAVPSLDHAVLERLELIQVSTERLLLVLALSGGMARTIFVEVSSVLPREAVASVGQVLNERLSGLTLREIRATLRQRLRDAPANGGAGELLNIFVEEAEHLFESPRADSDQVMLGSAQLLAEQPEFSSNEQMKTLLELTERRDVLRAALRNRRSGGLTVTIGGENLDPRFSAFTIVTSSYRHGALSGVIGVMGPTRMPYQKIVSLVEHTSQMVGDLLK
ncbi:MAG: heat-inducible transcription repressor HrcA [Gemmatimonadetes bacterium]|nr:heat-inducible transcription repressor HrcA [Gemmatimonadota bacterium]